MIRDGSSARPGLRQLRFGIVGAKTAMNQTGMPGGLKSNLDRVRPCACTTTRRSRLRSANWLNSGSFAKVIHDRLQRFILQSFVDARQDLVNQYFYGHSSCAH